MFLTLKHRLNILLVSVTNLLSKGRFCRKNVNYQEMLTSLLALCIPSWGHGVCPLLPLNDGNIKHSQNVVAPLSSFISKWSSCEAHIYQSRQGSSCSWVFGLASTACLTNCLWIAPSKAPSTPLLSLSPDKCSSAASTRHMPPSYLLLSAIRWPALHSRMAHYELLYLHGCWKPSIKQGYITLTAMVRVQTAKCTSTLWL